MITKQPWMVPRRAASAADFANIRMSIEVDRRLAGLLAEAAQRRLISSARRSMRMRLGLGLMHLGEAVSGVELHQHAAEPRVG